MLASIFSKTRPINYIILTILIAGSYAVSVFHLRDIQWSNYEIVKKSSVFVLLLLMTYLSQFIATRNRLVSDNAYVPLLFVSFLLLFPTSVESSKVVISAFFIMLALRRIFALQSLKQSKEKIFDAALWIFVASLFHFWSILFIILLFFSLTFYGAKDYRNWIIPIIAFFVVMTFLGVYLAVMNENVLIWATEKCSISFDFMYFENMYQNAALSIFVSISLLYFISQALSLPSKPFNMQNTHKKVIISFLIGVAIYIISADKNNGMLLFTFFPLAVLGSNYIENITQNWRKEANVFSIFLIGAISFILQCFYL
ncbi:MAG: DUF6427 family protein [Flavobacteriaceae bacterium]|jgi:hypothetical protein|nr:DUF6427 family protein [Flavobacteriaceae bacterium]